MKAEITSPNVVDLLERALTTDSDPTVPTMMFPNSFQLFEDFIAYLAVDTFISFFLLNLDQLWLVYIQLIDFLEVEGFGGWGLCPIYSLRGVWRFL